MSGLQVDSLTADEAHKKLQINVSCRPTKGSGDDSEEEGGASHPKKQRKPKERKRIEKVSFFFSKVTFF